jgi:hypothetical protein
MLVRPSRRITEGSAVDERSTELMREGQPIRIAEPTGSTPGPIANPLDDPRALTILSTEHWSLLSARALVYNEAFSRVGMFLTFLSATLVALGLVSTATGFNRDFLFVAALTLTVDLFIGLSTLGRVIGATAEDLRYLAAMNRIRHGYHDMLPGLARYFVTGQHDDARGAWAVYGEPDALAPESRISAVAHGFTTMPGLTSSLCAIVFALLVDVLLLIATEAPLLSAVGGIAAFVIAIVVAQVFMIRSIKRFAESLRPEFPTPTSPRGDKR